MKPGTFRTGTAVNPALRISQAQMEALHAGSMRILDDPGLTCFNEEAVSIFSSAGCRAAKDGLSGGWQIRIPEKTVRQALEAAPSRIVLGARNPANALDLDAENPRVYFGTGSEANVFLETRMERFQALNDSDRALEAPVFEEKRGTLRRLCDSSRLCNALGNVDFFIRNVNIQDEGVTEDNKDVNVFFASLMYMTKHVQAGLTRLGALDAVQRMAEIIAGGEEALRENPIISFITCLVKSPLQMVDDTTQKTIAVARRRWPVVISSSPQGGSTAPIQEEGMVALINAEILAGVTLAQLASPGAPVLYGAVPVRARLDNLHDFYGAPEFVHYNVDCVQMARYYGLPCYSTAGVGDAAAPGLQATVEKLLTHLGVAAAGAQYIHYAFGLLDRTNTFCPLQAVLDDAAVSLVRQTIRAPRFGTAEVEKAAAEIKKVMASGTRLFARGIRRHVRRGLVSEPYRLAGGGAGEALASAAKELETIRSSAGEPLPEATVAEIRGATPGLLDMSHFKLTSNYGK